MWETIMNVKVIGQLAGALVLTVGLAGCIDVTMDVEVLNDTTGKATTTMVMGADFYAMAKAGMAAPPAEGQTAPAQDGFCEEEGSVLTENADGSATCTMVVEGAFADLFKEEGGDSSNDPKIEVLSPGVVKVSFPTADMLGDELGTEGQDEQTKAMMAALFEGKTITIRVHGKQITESNMTISADKTSAEIAIPFLDLINGTATLPAELTATVNTN
jgi:hypothetical protein